MTNAGERNCWPKAKGDAMRKCGKKTEVYSRVVGYFRPVQNWNAGKKEEFKQRLTFKIDGLDHETDFSGDLSQRGEEKAAAQSDALTFS